MSTNNGPVSAAPTIEELEGLWRGVCEDLQNGKRSASMRATLRCALEYFRENRLGTVTASGAKVSAEDLAMVFSQQVKDLPFSQKARESLDSRKVVFAGEAAAIRFRGSGTAGRGYDSSFITNEILRVLGLTAQPDDVTKYWTPPYWSEDGFRAALNTSLGALPEGSPKVDPLACASDGAYCLGEFLIVERRREKFGADGRVSIMQSRLDRVFMINGYPLRGPMLIPPDWQAPTVPEETKKLMKQAYEQIMRMREEIREERRHGQLRGPSHR